MPDLRIALAQINVAVGDLDGNVAKILEYAGRAREQRCDIVAFPELAVTGYPPEDLLLRRRFVLDNLAALERIVERAPKGITLVVGFVDTGDREGAIYNAAAVISDGRIAEVYRKHLLPNYGVFDEDRYFQPGTETPVLQVAAGRFGVTVCEDIWFEDGPQRPLVQAGAEAIVNINGSPYYAGRAREREEMLAARAIDIGAPVCYVNLVGGQDELVFDGGSVVVNERGAVIARAAVFEEELLVCDLGETKPASRIAEPLTEEAEVYAALVTGTRDYVAKVGFENVYVGLSGGVDSSLVATLAADALGPSHVVAVAMPSRYSSEGSIADARELAEHLGIELMVVPIEPAHSAFAGMLTPAFAGTEPGLAEENLQARIRGNVLMALSNKFGRLVLTTGNKSEYATGYCTLYGDMAGGFAVIKDVPKTLVYRLAEERNRVAGTDLIPRSVIEKPPSAELRPDQLDTDSLPPYDVLDAILEAYVEKERSLEEIVALGHEDALVRRVMGLVDGSEYKRRQAPPGVKITPRAFGRDRRLPIANRYRGF